MKNINGLIFISIVALNAGPLSAGIFDNRTMGVELVNASNEGGLKEKPIFTSSLEGGDSSFSAQLTYRHDPSNTVMSEARVLYGSSGLRIEQMSQASRNVFVANYKEEKFWFMDRRRQLVHSIPVSVREVESGSDIQQEGVGLTRYISLLPCIGMEAKKQPDEIWKGRSLERWDCIVEGAVVEEQWFSVRLGLVVRSRTPEGFVTELSNINVREVDDEIFSPPAHYRPVSIEELINPAIPIGPYVETQ